MKAPTAHLIAGSKKILLAAGIFFVITATSVTRSYAALTTSTDLTQAINTGTLSLDIVDGTTYSTVASPNVNFSATTAAFICSTTTATLGTSTQTLYVQNPDASRTGWTLSLAATGGSTALWTSVANPTDHYDYNDPGTGDGCTDKSSGDADSDGGQLTVNPSTATIANGNCTLNCDTVGVAAGSQSSYVEGTTNSIQLINAGATSSDVADYKITGISLSQKVPKDVRANNDYKLNMTVTLAAQ